MEGNLAKKFMEQDNETEKPDRYFRVNSVGVAGAFAEYIIAEDKYDAVRKVGLMDFYRKRPDEFTFTTKEMNEGEWKNEQEVISADVARAHE